jgi:predicted nucleic acid-binding protein
LILADTAVWVDHLHHGDEPMAALLDAGEIVIHPHVIGEIALGSLRNRAEILEKLRALPRLMVAEEEEVAHLIEQRRLFGAGIGYVDAHLLSACLLTPGTRLWTRDKKLRTVAQRLGVAHGPAN